MLLSFRWSDWSYHVIEWNETSEWKTASTIWLEQVKQREMKQVWRVKWHVLKRGELKFWERQFVCEMKWNACSDGMCVPSKTR